MAELNDEQALSMAEQIVTGVRALKHLEELTRHLRDARKDLPTLQETLTALRAEQAAALEATAAVKAQRDRESVAYEQWAAETEAARQVTAAAVAAEREQLTQSLGSVRAELAKLVGQRDELRAEVTRLEARVTADRTRVADLGREAEGLTATLRDLKAELAALKKKHGLT
jgi:uncharacterized coiled-coil DUF342 family protein